MTENPTTLTLMDDEVNLNRFWVAIVDEGVEETYVKLSGILIKEVTIDEIGNIYDGDDGTKDVTSNVWHGTNIACIISEITGDINILSIKLTRRQNITVKQLCAALDYCAKLTYIRLINISLGVRSNKANSELRMSCERCFEAGKILIAAGHSDSSKPCYPAAFPFVYGVGTGLIKNRVDFSFTNKKHINILAKGIYQRLLGKHGGEIIGEGTSYAAASFTGILSNILKRFPSSSKKEIDRMLKLKSKDSLPLQYSVKEYNKKRDFSIECKFEDDVVLFPSDDQRIISLADEFPKPYLMLFPVDPEGKYATTKANNIVMIPGILSEKIPEKAKTLVVGNFLNNEILINRIFGWFLIDLYLKYNTQVLVMDNYISECINQRAQELGKHQARVVRL